MAGAHTVPITGAGREDERIASACRSGRRIGPGYVSDGDPADAEPSYGRSMSEDSLTRPEPCIERRHPWTDEVIRFSVFEYDAAMRRGRSLSHSKARAFHGVIWTEAAPEVQELTLEWQETREGSFRISDWDLYDTQMRQLIGLEPKPDTAFLIF